MLTSFILLLLILIEMINFEAILHRDLVLIHLRLVAREEVSIEALGALSEQGYLIPCQFLEEPDYLMLEGYDRRGKVHSD